jgi:hypothetical protein
MKSKYFGAALALVAPLAFGVSAHASGDSKAAAFAAAQVAKDVCATAKRNGTDLSDAARHANLRIAEPGMALPSYTPGSLAWLVPSSEGQVFLYQSANASRDCLIAIAYSPAEGADLAADALEKAGMRKGANGRIGAGGRYQQLTTQDGRIWVNAVAYERVAGKPAPAITAALQVGAN